ncbi:MAG: ribosome maturation factor RimP [Bacillota bacterium]|nr:ribosome maturation factor RimP [Bacillota bacterium]
MAKVNDLIALWMSELDSYELSRSEFVKEADTWYLRVFVDKLENGEYVSMGTEDCEKVSRFLSEKLDKNDPIEQNYYLEVSSPGLDRLLVSEKDFKRFAGQMVDVKLYKAIEKKKEISGILVGVENDILTLTVDSENLSLPMSSVAKINLTVVF